MKSCPLLGLLEIISYISQSRPTAVEGLCRTLIEAISELERLPLQGPLVPDLTVLTGIEIRRLLISSYSVLYSCKGGEGSGIPGAALKPGYPAQSGNAGIVVTGLTRNIVLCYALLSYLNQIPIDFTSPALGEVLL